MYSNEPNHPLKECAWGNFIDLPSISKDVLELGKDVFRYGRNTAVHWNEPNHPLKECDWRNFIDLPSISKDFLELGLLNVSITNGLMWMIMCLNQNGVAR